ncbi:MAG: hypothetical protein Q7W55_09470 [Pseudohongiella sp.]|nr:hypothetical protein [Pseudohongiella sp.]
MAPRHLLFILVAANLLFLLWSLVRPEGGGGEQLAAQEFASSRGMLVHINEQATPLSARYSIVSNPPGLLSGLSAVDRIEALQQGCLALGPFSSEEAARAVMPGLGISFNVIGRRELVAESPFYRAMIPPSASRELALLRLSEVRSTIERIGGGIDTYLVTSGPITNAVSLGVFGERSNALNVQSLLSLQGVDVVIEQENRTEVRFWVVANDPKAFEFIGENDSLSGLERVSAELSENLCETIAQAE